ncbi:hypothetical protein GF354_06100 [Candidatus Peregrinibacteria bacterium]|nr:hypothetical protein [Candidatus Peregrinibacteria bacterium]
MKKLLILVLISLSLGALLPMATYAQTVEEPTAEEPAVEEPTAEEPAVEEPLYEGLTEETFDVSEFLRLEDEEEQAVGYFKDSNNAPLFSAVFTTINFAIKIMGSIAVILLIVSGFIMMISQGNEQQLDQAKDILKYALIGIAIALLSYVIIITVQSFFNY